jgi:NAD(P)-dependent dehydrogenase (short-subunit alcohol dehydrogenase family)
LGGAVAVVTGGGRGLGAAYAEALAVAGARVAIFARSADELAATAARIDARGGSALAIAGDTTDAAAVREACAEVEATLGPVDLLVCAAGVGTPFGPTWELDADDWWRTVEVNLRGPLLWARALLPGMLARRRGRIINVSSGAGNGAFPFMSAYATSKAALTRLTEELAAEIGDRGVSVFAFSPGPVRTAMAEAALSTEAGRRWLPWFAPMLAEHGTAPEASAAYIVWLASGAADALTGRFLSQRDDRELVAARATGIREADRGVLRLRPLLSE